MTDETSVSIRLLELQTTDQGIQDVRRRVDSFGPVLEKAEGSVLRLTKEAEATSLRTQELHGEESRLRRAAEEKRARVHRLEDRLNLVRTVREEAAVQTELGMLRRALDSEEREVISHLDQIRKLEERLADQLENLDEARSVFERRKKELLAEQENGRAELASLELQRGHLATEINPRYRRVYDNLIRSGRRVAVASMTEDGACGACFSIIPLQIQNEIRTSCPLVLCEACGVIITAPLASVEDDAVAEIPGEAETPSAESEGE